MLVFTIIFTGCASNQSEVLKELVSKKADKLTMYIFSDVKFSYDVNGVHNSEPALQENIEGITIYTETDNDKWLKELGLEEERPVILIFDTEKMVFHTNDPEQLREFAKSLNKQLEE